MAEPKSRWFDASSAPLAFEGRNGSFALLGLQNALLTLLTLGIWRFWAKTRVRRALWSSTTLFGDHLEYTGTGGELFRGVLKALLLFFPLSLLPTMAELMWPNGAIAEIVSAAVGITFGLLALYALYAARRYVASRTTWRGLRFALDGTPSSYMANQVRWSVLLLPTLGLAYPYLLAAQSRWLIGNLRLGSARFDFDGRGRELFGVFLVSILINLGSAVLLLPLASALGTAMLENGRLAQGLSVWHWLIVTVPLALLVGPGSFWFRARHLRWQAAHASLEGARFAMHGVSTARLFTLLLGNALIRLLTLGVLGPVAAARTFAFYARHLRADGMPDLSQITQAETGPSTGEGLEALVGGDAFAG
jgi:uncharacterized membrane protein YjgN (DUF898 family)